MPQLRDEAEALATGLEIGACDVAEVIAWSDAQLLREDPPPAALCDVSVSQERYPQDVAGLLRQLPGVPDKRTAGRLLLTLIDAKLAKDPSRGYQIALALYRMALADEIEDPRVKEIGWWAWDALDLADAGHIQETREHIIEQMSAALHQAAAEADVTWSIWAVSPEGARPMLLRTPARRQGWNR
jgi:hypothetical protein